MIFGHSHPIDAARYRSAWRGPIHRARPHDGHHTQGDMHIDHDWQTSLSAVDRDEHRADACRQRAADIKFRRKRRQERLQKFING